MKLLLKISTLFILINSCVPDQFAGKALNVNNNSDENIYFWISADYAVYHFPDTILPATKPLYINFAPANGGAGSGGTDPDWINIYCQLPQGKLSVYFFDKYANNQQEWADVRESNLILRKDVTLEDLKNSDYIIYYR